MNLNTNVPNEIYAVGMAVVVCKIINLHFMSKNITKLYKDPHIWLPWYNKNPWKNHDWWRNKTPWTNMRPWKNDKPWRP